MNEYDENRDGAWDGSKRNWGIIIVRGLFTLLIIPIFIQIVSITYNYWLEHGGAQKYLRIIMPEEQTGEVEKQAVSPPKKVKIPNLPEIPLQVLDYSSQKNASYPALAVVDGDPETLWMSGSSSNVHSLLLCVARKNAVALTNLQICTASANSQYADLAVRSVTLFSSQELSKDRNLDLIGTYELPPGDRCYLCKFPEPRTLQVLILQVNEPAGSSAAVLSEIVAYAQRDDK